MPFLSQAYQKGAAPKSRILPAGGKVLTSEEEYNLLSDRHFPDPLGECLNILSQSKFLDLLCLGRPAALNWGRSISPSRDIRQRRETFLVVTAWEDGTASI